MTELQTELASYGAVSRGLAHYALGRGHMALHEYPQALTELELAIKQGKDSPDVHYALGFVLGKHFEKAMYEARLSGGGDWAKKQLKEIEPRYLVPALSSLQRSRAVKLDAPSYLEGLIAYFQRDYAAAIRHANAALVQAPWLYEAHKLSGDVHFEQALQARDSGKHEDAEKEFAAAVKSYQEAASIGQSDGEVYEGLAETWVRQIETAGMRGTPSEAAYLAAVEASEKISRTEPQSVTGQLKKGYAALMTMGMLGTGQGTELRLKRCMAETQDILERDGDNPYARDVAAGCYAFAADGIATRGEDPGPSLQRAMEILEPAVTKYPRFLWGLNDMANIYTYLGEYYGLRGNPLAWSMLEKAVIYQKASIALDGSYVIGLQNYLSTLSKMAAISQTEEMIDMLLSNAADKFQQCRRLSSQFQQCPINFFAANVNAAARKWQMGRDPQPYLHAARSALAAAGKLEGTFLDVEQFGALAALIDANDRIARSQDPSASLNELREALERCLAINANDGMCLSLGGRGELAAADWAVRSGKSAMPYLRNALDKSRIATEKTPTFSDSWRVLAETYLKMTNLLNISLAEREQYVDAGLAAVEKAFSINPNHALAHATKGALLFKRAQLRKQPADKRAIAQSAVLSLSLALQKDSFLSKEFAAPLAAAKTLAAGP